MTSFRTLVLGFFILYPLLGVSAPIGYGKLTYQLPEPGSYDLPSLGLAADGEVLTGDGESIRLHSAFDKEFTVLAFIYSSCNDEDGCPLSSYVLYQLKNEIDRNQELEKKLKLISLSFDPVFDTPEMIKLYENGFKKKGEAKNHWDFLTTRNERKLEPILKAYGQDVQRIETSDKKVSVFSHILRVYLIDKEKNIRNIYNVDFLHKDMILNDVRNLIESGNSKSQLAIKDKSYLEPGDYRSGYDNYSFKTRSKSVKQRVGNQIDLMIHAKKKHLGYPSLNVPTKNQLTKDKVHLGRTLFFDRRLSLNDTFSCAMCHIPEQGFTSNEMATAVGFEGRSVKRNAPTLLNVGFAKKFFHDGREDSLENQIWGPLLAKNEMANPSIGYVINKLKNIDEYKVLFKEAFGNAEITMLRVSDSLASYQRTLIAGSSRFDRWYFDNSEDALSDSEKEGFKIFTGKAGCSSCHVIGTSDALFSDESYRNTGLGYSRAMQVEDDVVPVQVAPGITVNVDKSIVDQVSEDMEVDLGRYEVTQDPNDRWFYKTPSLRNIQLTYPYMHDGSLGTLEEVIDFYDNGGIANPLLDPLIKPLGLTKEEKQQLVDFLESLTGDDVSLVVADAFSAPIGDPK